MIKWYYEPELVLKHKPKQPEPFNMISQSSVILEAQRFDFRQQQEHSLDILMRIIYLINQGIKFQKKDQDILFFSLIRVFESENEIVRRFAAINQQLIIPQEYSYTLLSCIARDIISSQVYTKLSAIKLLPLINDQCNLVQIEKLWQNLKLLLLKEASFRENQLISNSAIIQAIKIYQKFPQIIQQWFQQIVNLLKQKKKHKNYHALILLEQISRENQIYYYNFIKLLSEITKEDATPIFKIHLIKYIKGIINQEREQQSGRVFINFIVRELNNQDKMVALEAAKVLISIQQQVQDIQRLGCFLIKQLELESNNIIRHFILQLYLKIVNQSEIQLTDSQISFLQKQSYDKNVSSSFTAIKIGLIIQKSINMSDYITKLYLDAQLLERIHFLNGLNEFVLCNNKIGQQLDKFIQTKFYLIDDFELMKAAIHFIQFYIQISSISEEISIKILLNYANSKIPKVKYAVIVLLRKVRKLQCPPMNINEIEEEITKLQIYYKEYFAKNKNQKIETNMQIDVYELKHENNRTEREEQKIETTSSLGLDEEEESHLIQTDE